MTEILDVNATCPACTSRFPILLDHTWNQYVTFDAMTKKKLFGHKKILQIKVKREDFECPSCHQRNTLDVEMLIEDPTQKGLEIWMWVTEKKKQAKTPPATSIAPPATASSERPDASTQASPPDCIGVRFDIGKLESGGYGEAAWKVFWNAVDIELLAGSQLLEGDTNATPDRENVYCLAVNWPIGPARADDVRRALEQSEEYRRVSAPPAFIGPLDVQQEPLVDAGRVDRSGQLVGTSFRARPALREVTAVQNS